MRKRPISSLSTWYFAARTLPTSTRSSTRTTRTTYSAGCVVLVRQYAFYSGNTYTAGVGVVTLRRRLAEMFIASSTRRLDTARGLPRKLAGRLASCCVVRYFTVIAACPRVCRERATRSIAAHGFRKHPWSVVTDDAAHSVAECRRANERSLQLSMRDTARIRRPTWPAFITCNAGRPISVQESGRLQLAPLLSRACRPLR